MKKSAKKVLVMVVTIILTLSVLSTTAFAKGKTSVSIHNADGLGSNNDSITISYEITNEDGTTSSVSHTGTVKGGKLDIDMETEDNYFDLSGGNVTVSYTNNSTGESGTFEISGKEGNDTSHNGKKKNEQDNGKNNFNASNILSDSASVPETEVPENDITVPEVPENNDVTGPETEVPENNDVTAPEDIEVPENNDVTVPEDIEVSENNGVTVPEDIEVPENNDVTVPEDIEVPENNNVTVPEDIEVPENNDVTVPENNDVSEDTEIRLPMLSLGSKLPVNNDTENTDITLDAAEEVEEESENTVTEETDETEEAEEIAGGTEDIIENTENNEVTEEKEQVIKTTNRARIAKSSNYVTINDEPIPLADVPETGDGSIVIIAAVLAAMLGLAVLNKRAKNM